MNAYEIAAVVILATTAIWLVVREELREQAAWIDHLVNTIDADATIEPDYDPAMQQWVNDTIRAGNQGNDTPTFDAALAEHPWVAEQMLAHDLNDDDAVARWLS